MEMPLDEAAVTAVFSYLIERDDTAFVEDVVPESEDDAAGISLYWYWERTPGADCTRVNVGVIAERWPGDQIVGLNREKCHFVMVYTLSSRELVVIPAKALRDAGNPVSGARDWVTSLPGVKTLTLTTRDTPGTVEGNDTEEKE